MVLPAFMEHPSLPTTKPVRYHARTTASEQLAFNLKMDFMSSPALADIFVSSPSGK